MRSFNQTKPPVVLLVESPDANALADCSITITGKRPDDDDGTGRATSNTSQLISPRSSAATVQSQLRRVESDTGLGITRDLRVFSHLPDTERRMPLAADTRNRDPNRDLRGRSRWPWTSYRPLEV